MAVVYNIKGTSESEFQIGKSGPKLVKSSNDLEIQTPGGTLNLGDSEVAGNMAHVSGFHMVSVNNNVTAAGTDQSTAEPITNQINKVSTVDTGSGVVLPAALAGMRITIFNAGANDLLVYPALGGHINQGATNSSYSLTAGQGVDFIATDITEWLTLPQ